MLKDPCTTPLVIEENWKEGHHEADTPTLTAGFGSVSRWTRFAILYGLAYLLWKETGETSQFDEICHSNQEILTSLDGRARSPNNSPYRLFVIQTVRKTL